MSHSSKLYSPIRIGSMELATRIVMAPMTVDYGQADETPSERQIAYYSERAQGGVSLIGLEVCSVDADHRYQQHSLGLHSDEQIAGHRPLVDAIHAHGVKVQPQLSHPGPESLAPFFKQIQPMGPSVIRTETTKQACREITLEEIEAVIEMYGDAARRAREAGYDGVELHAAHSYMMLGSFLSPLRNFRTDDYAGHKFEGRARLLLQVVENIRGKVGRDFPLTVRLSGFERESGGRESGDSQRLAPLLVEAGVDCFHVSGGVGDANITQIITGPEYGPGYNLAAATAIKQVVDVPVMAVGQNMDPRFAESIVDEGRVDLVAMGRALLADPELPRKAREGRLREINRCNLCQGCVDTMTSEFNGAGCSVNPRVGREAEHPKTQADTSKKVLVIGGGPGGLAAALYACERGHQVTLIERENELGGAFRWASTAFPGNQLFLDYLIGRVRDLPIDVILGKAADRSMIEGHAPDAIIVATGGRFTSPTLPGADAEHVLQGDAVPLLIEQIRNAGPDAELPLGQRIAIIGANLIGLELAELLVRRGRRVHVVEPSGRMATPAGKKRRGDHTKQLDALGVPVNTHVAIEAITKEGVALSLSGGGRSVLGADTVIVVGHPEADPSFAEQLQGLALEVHGIGDSTGFGLSKKAVSEAMQVAWAL
jgi:2,4-dienoyl-CoA reductase (NADPH2)